MTELDNDDSLLEWNRLNKENAEHGFVSALFQSMSETSPLVEKFSIWLLAGTGATAALLITQINSVLPYLSEEGFKSCLVILVLSATAGFIAKYFSLRCEIQNSIQNKLMKLMKPVFDKHEKDEDKIREYAEERGIVLQTEMDFSMVISEFSKPFPFWVKWLITRKIKQISGDRQVGFHIAVIAYTSQIRWTFFQVVLFMIFILAAAWHANTI